MMKSVELVYYGPKSMFQNRCLEALPGYMYCSIYIQLYKVRARTRIFLTRSGIGAIAFFLTFFFEVLRNLSADPERACRAVSKTVLRS